MLLQVSFRLVVSPFGLNRSGQLLPLEGSRRPVASAIGGDATKIVWDDFP